MLACAAAGADVVDVAIDGESFLCSSSASRSELTSLSLSVLSGLTSQPAMGAICGALEQSVSPLLLSSRLGPR